MYVYICTCIYTYTYPCIYIYVYTYVYICIGSLSGTESACSQVGLNVLSAMQSTSVKVLESGHVSEASSSCDDALITYLIASRISPGQAEC